MDDALLVKIDRCENLEKVLAAERCEAFALQAVIGSECAKWKLPARDQKSQMAVAVGDALPQESEVAAATAEWREYIEENAARAGVAKQHDDLPFM